MTSTPNTLRRKLETGAPAFGVGVRLTQSVEIARLLAVGGYDWIFIDLEHSYYTLETACQLSLTSLSAGITPLVRVPTGQYTMGTRALDGGAWGIVVPHVENAETARAAVHQFKFPPVGMRSVGPAMPQMDYISSAQGADAFNKDMLLVAVIETPKGVENAGEIAAVPGIDVLLVGTNDLAMTMGVPGGLAHEKVISGYKKVIEACTANGKWPGVGGVYDDVRLPEIVRMGFKLVIAGVDQGFLVAGLKQRLDVLRKSAG